LLAERFLPVVADCARLHVAAKRYLCAVDESYFAELSPASVRSLKLQCGRMNAAEIAAFKAEPNDAAAVEIRRYDDAGEVAGMEVPRLEHYGRFVVAASL